MSDRLLVKLLSTSSKLPIRGSKGAAGYDVFSDEDATIEPWTRQWISTGIAIRVPKNSFASMRSRSSLAEKGIDVGAGVIDEDYTGHVKVLLINNSDNTFTVGCGMKIAQMIIHPILTPDQVMVSDLEQTERGENGFGSTGQY